MPSFPSFKTSIEYLVVSSDENFEKAPAARATRVIIFFIDPKSILYKISIACEFHIQLNNKINVIVYRKMYFNKYEIEDNNR